MGCAQTCNPVASPGSPFYGPDERADSHTGLYVFRRTTLGGNIGVEGEGGERDSSIPQARFCSALWGREQALLPRG